MSEIFQRATAGTMESSDAYVEIEPNENGLEIRLESVVLQQFGQDIEQSVRRSITLRRQRCQGDLIDRGALDCVIRAGWRRPSAGKGNLHDPLYALSPPAIRPTCSSTATPWAPTP